MTDNSRKQHEKIQPVEQHHVADFGVKCKRNATQISGKADDVSLQTHDTPVTVNTADTVTDINNVCIARL